MSNDNASMQLMEQRHWQPPDRLKVNIPPGMSARWVRKDEVTHRLGEGYVIAYKKNHGGDIHINPESTSIDGAFHYRSHVLMLLPKHMAQERTQWWLSKHNQRLTAALTGAGMESEAAKINAGKNGKVVGAIGSAVVESGTIHEDGSVSGRQSQEFVPGMAPEESNQELKDLRKKQADENARLARSRKSKTQGAG